MNPFFFFIKTPFTAEKTPIITDTANLHNRNGCFFFFFCLALGSYQKPEELRLADSASLFKSLCLDLEQRGTSL